MSYSIQVAPIGRHGFPVGPFKELAAPSEREAIAAMRGEIVLAQAGTRPMRFNVYGPGRRLVLSYMSEARPALIPEEEAAR